jgi:Ku protein
VALGHVRGSDPGSWPARTLVLRPGGHGCVSGRPLPGKIGLVPRSLWSGSITFGLVNVPARIYSAIEEHKLQFRLVHRKDSSPIGYQKICKEEDKPVPDDEIVKAFEVEDGEFVFVEDEDFEAAQIEGYKTIDITDFVPYADIDPIYFAKTYYVGPQDGSEKVYSLLVEAMERSELAAIAKFVMRERQHLGCLRVREGVITLEQLYFADEIRPIDEIKPSSVKVDKRELEMAMRLIDSFAGEWKPAKYKDTYREALLAVIEAKRKGKEVHRPKPEAEEEPVDLMAALRASIEAAGRGKPARARRRNGGADLAGLSKAELEERAKKAGIPGRSKMTKDELVEALRSAA